jgi:hypothetical protein
MACIMDDLAADMADLADDTDEEEEQA